MHRNARFILTLLCLASYMLANTGAWVHQWSLSGCCTSGEYCATLPVPSVDQSSLATRCGHPGCSFAESTAANRSADPVGAAQPDVSPQQDSSPTHQHDQCTICRFLIILKAAPEVVEPDEVAQTCPEPAVELLPVCRVASLPDTPQSRAPPVPA